MPHAIRIHQTGGPEVLSWDEVPTAEPGPSEIRVRHTAVGLNYIDTYHRNGLYPLPLPAVIGMEAAGVVDAVGSAVADFREGDRVAYAGGGPGSYAELRIIAADKVVKVPDSIDDEQAAAMMLKGMTAAYLLRRTFKVEPGQTVLFHAAAGGVGLIACQWLKQLGATVIGTVGSPEKAELAKQNGCDHAVLYNSESYRAVVEEVTGGAGVPVVYDSVGAATFEESLDCLSPFGTFVSFGNASGPVPPFNPGILAQKGSLYFTRPTLMTHIAKRADLIDLADSLFAAMDKGLAIQINQRFKLADAEEAHRRLEARDTTGSTILLP